MIAISPTIITKLEFQDFTQDYTLTYSEDLYDPLIDEEPTIDLVTIVFGELDFTNRFNIVISDFQHFSITGQMDDVFNRQMVYIKHNVGGIGNVTRWEDIPDDFDTIFKYTGSSEMTKTFTVHVETSVGNVDSELVIQQNWELSNSHLKEYVERGVY